jgi:hypothetical protein
VKLGYGYGLALPERLSIRRAKAKFIFEFFTACFALLHDRLLVPGLNYGGETTVFEKLAAQKLGADEWIASRRVAIVSDAGRP